MLTHDPITIPYKLLQGRWSEAFKAPPVFAQEPIGLAEHEAYSRPIRLPLMELASYTGGSLSVGRDVEGMSHSRKVITTNDPLRAKTLTHPMIEQAKNNKTTRGTHQRTPVLSYLHYSIINLTHLSSKLYPASIHVRKTVTDIMRFVPHTQTLGEGLAEVCRETCGTKTSNDSTNRIMSKPISGTSEICAEEDLTAMDASSNPSKTFLFRLRSIRKDLRNALEHAWPDDLSGHSHRFGTNPYKE